MRETKNIIMYGFLLFLIIAGITVNIINNVTIINNIKCLSFPVFIFTISLLLVRTNSVIRQQTIENIAYLEQKTKNNEKKLERSSSDLENLMNNKNSYKNFCYGISQYKDQIKGELVETKKLTFLYKTFCVIDFFTILFNFLGILSFALCLLSITGLFSINVYSPTIEIFSLCIMYFDFFILDNLITKLINKKFNSIEKKAKKQVEKEISK